MCGRACWLCAGWLLLGSLVISGCDASTPAPSASQSSTAPAGSAPGLAVGTEVLAARGPLSFQQGTVSAVLGDQVHVRPGPTAVDGGTATPFQVTRESVWPLEATAVLEPGSAAICRLDRGREGSPPRWLPCRLGSAGNPLEVRDPRGVKHRIRRDQLVVPDELTRAAVANYLEREARHRRFDEAFTSAGRPLPPTGWIPAAGDAVVVRFVDTSWYSGKVLEVAADKGKVRISWDAGTWDDQDVPLVDVIPQPTAASSLKEGQYVIARPDDVSGRWKPQRVLSIAGPDAKLESRDGEEGERKLTDLVVVAH